MAKIAICFFGITRSLTFTKSSIERRVLRPAMSLGDVALFGHFFVQETIENRRSNEFGSLRQNEHLLLDFKQVLLEKPEQCLAQHRFEAIREFGDFWKDDFKSLRNLTHQLHSLDVVTKMALDWLPDIVVFARPDLRYHDNLRAPMREILGAEGKRALIPSWQHWRGGLNDRFALCTFGAASAYGTRINHALEFCEENQSPLHSESLLKHCLDNAGVGYDFIPHRASRIRFDGFRRKEDFVGVNVKSMRRIRRNWNKIMALK